MAHKVGHQADIKWDLCSEFITLGIPKTLQWGRINFAASAPVKPLAKVEFATIQFYSRSTNSNMLSYLTPSNSTEGMEDISKVMVSMMSGGNGLYSGVLFREVGALQAWQVPQAHIIP